MSQQRYTLERAIFGSSNTRVSGRDFRHSWQGLFCRYSWRNWRTRTADFINRKSTAVLFNILKTNLLIVFIEKLVPNWRKIKMTIVERRELGEGCTILFSCWGGGTFRHPEKRPEDRRLHVRPPVPPQAARGGGHDDGQRQPRLLYVQKVAKKCKVK